MSHSRSPALGLTSPTCTSRGSRHQWDKPYIFPGAPCLCSFQQSKSNGFGSRYQWRCILFQTVLPLDRSSHCRTCRIFGPHSLSTTNNSLIIMTTKTHLPCPNSKHPLQKRHYLWLRNCFSTQLHSGPENMLLKHAIVSLPEAQRP